MTESSVVHQPLRRVLIAITLGVLASPLASNASSHDQAMHACVQAFIAARLPKDQPVVVDMQGGANRSLSSHSSYTIVVMATGKTSGRQIAKGTCVVSRAGELISFDGRRFARSANRAVAANEVTAAR